MLPIPNAPFIVSLLLDPADQARFDALRTRHFPPERLVVGAHVTLFHSLPGYLPVSQAVAEQAGRPGFAVRVSGVRFLGRGVAYTLESPELQAVRARLRQRFADQLTPQDSQPFRPHVTIQNKADSTVARRLHANLTDSFAPYDVTATGLAVWLYRGGPWEIASRHLFRD